MRITILLLLPLVLPQFAAASPPLPELSAEISQIREVLRTAHKDQASRTRMAEIGWEMAAEIEHAEAREDLERARAIAGQVEEELPDIIWRTKHFADQKDDPRAQLARAVFHRTGTLLEQDETAACEYYRRASKHEIPVALWRFSLCAAHENREYARSLMQRAAVAGHPTAQQILAESWLAEQREERREEAIHLLQEAANAGRRSARLLIAALYETGTMIERDVDRAEEIYREIAAEGHAVAQNNLGALYQRKGSLDEASEWYRLAAEQGLPVAQLNLGLLYTQGEAPFDDGCQALDWIRKAADQGLELARKITSEPEKYNVACAPAAQ